MWLIKRTREDGTFSFVQKTDPLRMSRMNQAHKWPNRDKARKALTEVKKSNPTFTGTVYRMEPEPEKVNGGQPEKKAVPLEVKAVPDVDEDKVPSLVKASKPRPDVQKTPAPPPLVGDTEARLKHNMRADLLMATQVARRHAPGDRRSFAERMADELYRLGWRPKV